MGNLNQIKGVFLTKEKIINNDAGNILHAIKKNSVGFSSFGEAYFSNIKKNSVKAWKKHKKMTLNLIVPIGEVHFKLYDDRDNINLFNDFILSSENYIRLTVPPGIWFGFKGLYDPQSLILNVADIVHDDKEVEKKQFDDIECNWDIK